MTNLVQDKWLKFTIENYSDIASLMEVYEYAQKKLPDRVTSIILGLVLTSPT